MLKLSFLGLIAVALMVLAAPASARLTGAVWTTTAQGEKVNGNIYDQKCPPPPPPGVLPCDSPPLVPFLNGGPAFAHPGSWVPDGCYYFQVTDPAGKVLLSNDDIECRRFRVGTDAQGKKYIEYPVPPEATCPPPVTTCPDPHETCTDINTGITTIALCPFDNTPNPGGVYKLWITRVSAYNPLDPGSRFGFIPSESKTDNFKVWGASIWGRKVDEQGEPLEGVHIILYQVVKVKGKDTNVPVGEACTDANGEFSFSITREMGAGKYCVDEDLAGSLAACGFDYSGYERLSPPGPMCVNITNRHMKSGARVDIGTFVNKPVGPPPVVSLAGSKFLDANGNGLWDEATEPPLPCWQVCLDMKNGNGSWMQAVDNNGVLVPCQTTACDGTFNFGNLPVNMTYRVREVLKAGWKQTAPNTGPDEMIIHPGEGPCPLGLAPLEAPVDVIAKSGCYIVNVGATAIPETVVTGLCFGNKLAKLCVRKLQDGTGAPLAGWEFRLYEADGVTPATAATPIQPGGCDPTQPCVGLDPVPAPPIVTGADGIACWENLLGGTYVVKETMKNGWVGSDATTVTLAAGGEATVTFTNHSICMGLTPGYWKNWRNHYTDAQFCVVLQGTIADVGDCTADIAAADAIFDWWSANPDDYMTILKAFLLADQLTINLTQNPGLPNPSNGSLVPECVCGWSPTAPCTCGTVSLGDAIAAALDILAHPGDYTRDQVLDVKNELAGFAQAACL
jgi:hypothetical protein